MCSTATKSQASFNDTYEGMGNSGTTCSSLFMKKITFIYLEMMCGCVYVCATACVSKSEDNLWKSVLSFYHVNSRSELMGSVFTS